jgi:hypothetical protein
MSTTRIPPTQYIVKRDGCRSQVFPSISQAAGAIVLLIPAHMKVGAVTGMRTWQLTDRELHELGGHIRSPACAPAEPREAEHEPSAIRVSARRRVPVGVSECSRTSLA